MNEKVDEGVTGLFFSIVVRIWRSLVRLLGGGDFSLKTFDFVIKFLTLNLGREPRFFLLFERFLTGIEVLAHLFDLLDGARCDGQSFLKAVRVELHIGRRLCAFGVCAHQPIGEMK